MPDIEPENVGAWDDTQLLAIDQLMVEAHERGGYPYLSMNDVELTDSGIKLIIALHDRYMLGCWGKGESRKSRRLLLTHLTITDAYVTKYKLPAVDCNTAQASQNDVTFFYQDASPISDFDNRITHILTHRNALLPNSPQWKDLSSHIFAFNIQNEGQGHLRNNIAPAPQWWCDRSKHMRSVMGNSAVLISTGGGNEFPNSDIPENWACPTLDLVDIHSYNGVEGFKKNAPVALQHAKDAGKLVLFEEFGATGENKADVVGQHIEVFNGLKVPWMVWQINKPGKGAADYEFWTDEETFDVVRDGSSEALALKAAQPFPNL